MLSTCHCHVTSQPRCCRDCVRTRAHRACAILRRSPQHPARARVSMSWLERCVAPVACACQAALHTAWLIAVASARSARGGCFQVLCVDVVHWRCCIALQRQWHKAASRQASASGCADAAGRAITRQWLTVQKSVIRFRCKQMPLRMDVIHTNHQKSDCCPASVHRTQAMTTGNVSFKLRRSDAVDDTRSHRGHGCLRIRTGCNWVRRSLRMSVRTVSPGLFTR